MCRCSALSASGYSPAPKLGKRHRFLEDLAGLAAAGALAERDVDVVVLEGRDRIGGRCWTWNQVDFGAHWIHGTEGNPITTLARALGADTLFVGRDSSYTGGWEDLVLYTSRGRKLTRGEKVKCILLADEVREDLEELRRRRIEQDAPDVPLHEALEPIW